MSHQRFDANSSLDLHRHRTAYSALVLEGGYQEFGPDGRWPCQAGDVVVHPRNHLHGDRFGGRATRLLNLPSEFLDGASFQVVRVTDPDRLIRLAERDARCPADIEEIRAAVATGSPAAPLAPPAWLSNLAHALGRCDARSVSREMTPAGRSREHVSRAFKAWFGLSPVAYRSEHRIRRAAMALGAEPMATIAVDAGFYDQAHMCRLFRAAYGASPTEIKNEGVSGRHHIRPSRSARASIIKVTKR